MTLNEIASQLDKLGRTLNPSILRIRELASAVRFHAMRVNTPPQEAIDLLVRCYKVGHREGWQDGETNSEVFEAVNTYLTQHVGSDWGPRLVGEK